MQHRQLRTNVEEEPRSQIWWTEDFFYFKNMYDMIRKKKHNDIMSIHNIKYYITYYIDIWHKAYIIYTNKKSDLNVNNN